MAAGMARNGAQLQMQLLEKLNDLTQEEFATFKWHLKLRMPNIPRSTLDNAQRPETVNLMVHNQPHQAVDYAIEIFRAIFRNDLAEHLDGVNRIDLR